MTKRKHVIISEGATKNNSAPPAGGEHAEGAGGAENGEDAALLLPQSYEAYKQSQANRLRLIAEKRAAFYSYVNTLFKAAMAEGKFCVEIPTVDIMEELVKALETEMVLRGYNVRPGGVGCLLVSWDGAEKDKNGSSQLTAGGSTAEGKESLKRLQELWRSDPKYYTD